MSSIFFISLMSGSSWGGSEELWYRTALTAARQGIRVGCAVYHWPGKEKKLRELESAGCMIYYFPNKGRGKKNIRERLQNKLSKFRTAKMLKLLPVKEYDLVVVNQGAFEITTPVWRNFYRQLQHYVLLFHNYKEKEVFAKTRKNAIQNWISGSSMNFFASERIAEVLCHNSGIKISKKEVLINPITFTTPSQPSNYPALDNGNYRMVMLAALEVNRKAQDQLILALAQPRWRPRNWTLHLFGEGPDKNYLSELILNNQLQDKIFLEGQTGDVKQVLMHSHLVLQITHIDAMPISVVEAMAVGRPLVVSRIGDMPCWVKEEMNGWVSPDAAEQSISDTIEKAWAKRNEWERMGEKSFEIFSEKFPSSPAEYFLSRLKELYKN